MVDCLERQGHTLQQLLQRALADDWRVAGSENAGACQLRHLLHPKYFDEALFKGQGTETRALVYLLQYYAQHLLHRLGSETDVCRSFSLLHSCVRHLGVLASQWTPITLTDVQPLQRSEARHQAAFNQAYAADGHCKPKHHHRRHVAEAAVKLGVLPNCSVHESKHRQVKSHGTLDRQKKNVAYSEALQRALLPRLLVRGLEEADDWGFAAWALAGSSKPAGPELCNKLTDLSLKRSPQMKLLQVTVASGDILLWHDTGGQVLHCLSGSSAGLYILMTQFRKVRTEPWGSVWRPEGKQILVKPRVDEPFVQPHWWRLSEEGLLCCLH